MRISFLRLVAVATACVGPAVPAQANDIQFVNYQAMQQVIAEQNERLAQQNDRIGQLEARLVSFADGAAAPASGCCNQGGTCCAGNDGCCDSSGITWSAELLFLKLHNSDDNEFDDFHAAYRLTAGWQGCGDLGARLRYFDYENSTVDQYFDVFALDAEATSNFCLCNWDGLLSFGLRYSQLFLDDDGDVEADITASIGPVLGVELRHDLCCNTALFVMAREALLFGYDNAVEFENITWSNTEIQIGAEWYRERCCGGTLFLRGALEGQFYATAAESQKDTWGLVGGNVGVGILR